MGRSPCCDKANVKRGPWSPEEDAKLKEYIEQNGTVGNWIALPQKAGLKRCGKSCRLRWLNYLRPNIKHGEFSDDEDRIICTLFSSIGSRWSIIAAQLPGRTDNDVKNYWNTKLKKKLRSTIPQSQRKSVPSSPSSLRNSNYSQVITSSFPTFEPNSYSSSLLSTSSSTNLASNFQFSQETTSLAQMHHYQVKDGVLMFGGEENCKNFGKNHGGSGKNSAEMEIQSYFCNGYGENQKIMVPNGCSSNGYAERQSGMWEETSLEYGIEEIKQLISTSCSSDFIL